MKRHQACVLLRFSESTSFTQRDLRVFLGPSDLENLLADVPSVGTIVMEEIVKTQNVETQNVKEE